MLTFFLITRGVFLVKVMKILIITDLSDSAIYTSHHSTTTSH
jgi:hypothetical protein